MGYAGVDSLTEFVKLNFMSKPLADKKRETVLQAAHQIFLQFGYHRTTMGDLAKAAQMSRPALYLIFPNKEAIFRAVVTRYHEQTKKLSEQAIESSQTLESKLQACMKAWTETVYKEMASAPEGNEIYEVGYTIIHDLKESLSQTFINQLQDILENAPEIPADQFKKLDIPPHDLAELIAHSCVGLRREAKSLEQLQNKLHNLRRIHLSALVAP